MKQLDRIDKFLKSLEDNGIITAEMQSVVLSPDFGLLGGDNDGQCINRTAACNGVNNVCTNYNVCTSDASNETCKNLTTPTVNNVSLTCKPSPANTQQSGCTDFKTNPYRDC